MRHHLATSHHPPSAAARFSFDRLDAFHSEDVLTLVHGPGWTSIVIEEDGQALLHTHFKARIGATAWFDSDPFLGYDGPVANTADAGFLRRALARLSEVCRDEGLVAQVLRFNPLLGNGAALEKLHEGLRIVHAKDIVIVNCHADEAAQLAEFSTSRQRDLRRSAHAATFRILEGAGDRERFRQLYASSIRRVGADSRWHFSAEFFERAGASARVTLYGVEGPSGELFAAALAVHHPFASYWLLGAVDENATDGASKQLVHGMAMDTAHRGTKYLILGGGNSSSPEDDLLVWKSKFAPRLYPFHLGLWIHMPQAFSELTGGGAPAPYFLSYRRPSPPQ